MIKTQVIKKDNKPVAVIMDYREYLRLYVSVPNCSSLKFAAVRTDAAGGTR